MGGLKTHTFKADLGPEDTPSLQPHLLLGDYLRPFDEEDFSLPCLAHDKLAVHSRSGIRDYSFGVPAYTEE